MQAGLLGLHRGGQAKASEEEKLRREGVLAQGGPQSQKAKGSLLRLNKGAKGRGSPQSLALRLLHKKRLKDFRLVLFSKKCPAKEPFQAEGGLSQEGKMLGGRLSQHRACSKPSHLRTLGTQNNIKVNFFRHFVPASQEWYNSIYTYNKNYPKTIPVADISLMKLFKGYFNYGIRFKFPLRVQSTKGGVLPPLSPQNQGSQRPKAFGQIRARELSPLPMRYRLLSTKKAFLGKGDLKHTNNKVIITFYLYNANQMFISSNFNDRVKALLLPNKSLKILSFEQANPSGKIILYNRMFNIYEFLASDEHYLAYYNTMGSIIKKINIVLANLNYLLAIYIYILKTKIFNDNYARPSAEGTGSHPHFVGSPALPLQGSLRSSFFSLEKKREGASKILSGKINSFFFIYNNLFKTNILKDNLKNNLFNIFFNFRLRKYRRLLLKRKFLLITNDILKIASSPTGPAALGLERDSSSASAGWLDKKGILTQGGRPLFGQNLLRGAPFVSHLASKNLQAQITWEESSIFNFEYYLYKMSLSYLEKVFLY